MQSEEFKTFRKKLKKTQKQMAQLLGVSLKAIHSYEQGWRTIPGHVERQLYFLLARKSDKEGRQPSCWEVLQCPQEKREKCPAWEFSSGDLCWFINGTICDATVYNSWKDKIEVCKKCRVFKDLFRRIGRLE